MPYGIDYSGGWTGDTGASPYQWWDSYAENTSDADIAATAKQFFDRYPYLRAYMNSVNLGQYNDTMEGAHYALNNYGTPPNDDWAQNFQSGWWSRLWAYRQDGSPSDPNATSSGGGDETGGGGAPPGPASTPEQPGPTPGSVNTPVDARPMSFPPSSYAVAGGASAPPAFGAPQQAVQPSADIRVSEAQGTSPSRIAGGGNAGKASAFVDSLINARTGRRR